MAKHDLGTKRICTGCGTKFYDFNRSPAVCPKCETVYQETAREAPKPAAAKPAPAASKVEAEEVGGPEIVSLEDAEKEQLGTARTVGDDDDFDIDDDALDTDDPAADAFLEDDEDESDDVSGILGGGIDAGNEDEI